MKMDRILCTSSVALVAFLAISKEASAIGVPDSGTCTSGDPCLKISTQTTNGTALWGDGSAATGTTYGVYGYGSYGVKGQAQTGTAGTGVYGEADANGSGFGVWGKATGGGYGVYGTSNNASGYGGYFNNSAGFSTSLYVVGNAWATGTWGSPSDERLKKDIKDVGYGLDQVLKLHPVTYQWKDQSQGPGTKIGLIAQEVQKIVPEAVIVEGSSEMLGITYNALIPVMIRAAQEQQSLIQRQEARIATLERERKMTMASFFTGNLGEGVVLGLVPLGLAVALRRRRGQSSGPSTEQLR